MATISNKERRHKKIRSKVFGTSERPRLSVFKSNQFIYGQIIDDDKGVTILASDTRKSKDKTPLEKAKSAGKVIGEEAVKKGIKKVVFDRGGYLYIGKIKAFADGAREGGLEF